MICVPTKSSTPDSCHMLLHLHMRKSDADFFPLRVVQVSCQTLHKPVVTMGNTGVLSLTGDSWRG